jgi:deazaflavin-dependent oxidoreductase (nitroreductase family)
MAEQPERTDAESLQARASRDGAVIREFRSNHGRVGAWGTSLLLLHTVGARSGQAHVTPVTSIPIGDDAWFISASKAGAQRNPAWYHNVLAHPDVVIEVPDRDVVGARAFELSGRDRDEAWACFVALSPRFGGYQASTGRLIPVFRLVALDTVPVIA